MRLSPPPYTLSVFLSLKKGGANGIHIRRGIWILVDPRARINVICLSGRCISGQMGKASFSHYLRFVRTQRKWSFYSLEYDPAWQKFNDTLVPFFNSWHRVPLVVVGSLSSSFSSGASFWNKVRSLPLLATSCPLFLPCPKLTYFLLPLRACLFGGKILEFPRDC